MSMSDAEYVYRQDLRDKKITSYGAFHKKRGAKSKKCNFPSDYLTKKEKKKLNSEITTYDMSKFYAYDEFKKLPPDIQVEYLNTLIKKYDITVVTVAKEVFGVSSDAIRQMLVKSNVYNSLYRRPHFRPRKEDIERFQNDIFKARMVNFVGGTNAKKLDDVEKNAEETPVDINSVTMKDDDQPAPSIKKPADIIPQANLRETKITMEGFDLDTFNFLAKKYSGQEVEVRIKVVPKSHICTLSE